MSEEQTVSTGPGITRELTAFQRTILAILAHEPQYGLAIKRDLEDYYDDEVNHGRLYPNLDELVDLGLVEKSELDKRTNQYALTEEGYEAILDHLEWTIAKLATDETRVADVESLLDRVR